MNDTLKKMLFGSLAFSNNITNAEQEKVIIKADIRYIPRKSFLALFPIGCILIGLPFIFLSNDEFYFWSSLLFTVVGGIGLPLLIWSINTYISNNCTLLLNEKGIKGYIQTLYSKKALQLPIDKIDSIAISESDADKLRGGKTVVIRSASGLIKFQYVQNADEFVNITLAEIEKFKQSVKDKNIVSAISNNANNNNSATAKIKELKELLDSGLISQEEFETKRKELLNKM